MAIVVPTVLTGQLDDFRATLLPKVDAVTNVSSSPSPPYANMNRFADLFYRLCHLVDVSGLAATGGSTSTLQDTGAFTGAASDALKGSIVTFDGNVTAAIANHMARVASHTADELTFDKFWDASGTEISVLPGAVAAGDTYALAFNTFDEDIAYLRSGKGMADTYSNPYGFGPKFIDTTMRFVGQLGGSVPSWLNAAAAQPFGIGSPHAGAGSQGHGGAALVAAVAQLCSDTVAAYTAPA